MKNTPMSIAPAQRGPWGLGATLVFAVLLWLLARWGDQVIASALQTLLAGFEFGPDVVEPHEDLLGLRFSLHTCVRGTALAAIVLLLMRLRGGPSMAQYLALRPVRAASIVRWSVAVLAFDLAADLLIWWLDRDIVTDYNIALYETARVLPLFWLVLVVVAPIIEELLFRGFLFEGVRASRLGGAGAVLLTTLAWTAIHTQYEPFELAILFMLGLGLGCARLVSRSLYVPLAMHVLNNLVSGLEILSVAGGE